MARLYKRGDVWWIWGYDANGCRWYESTRQHDYQAAQKVARDIERRRASLHDAPEALGLEDVIRRGITHRQQAGRSPHTLSFWRQGGGHLCRIIGGGTDVHQLTLADTERYHAVRRGEGAKPSTIEAELRVLRAALRHAAKRGWYHGVAETLWPTELLRGAYVPRSRWLTQAEYARLWLALPEKRRDYLTAYVYTGARKSELWRIAPPDVDLHNGTLRLRGTKTRRSDRAVPIHPALRPILISRIEMPILFPRWEVDHVMPRYTAKAGISHVVCNDLRRTYCSWLAQAGVPMLHAARLMGHASTRMVERVYAQLAPDDLRDAVARLPTVTHMSRPTGISEHLAYAVDPEPLAKHGEKAAAGPSGRGETIRFRNTTGRGKARKP